LQKRSKLENNHVQANANKTRHRKSHQVAAGSFRVNFDDWTSSHMIAQQSRAFTF